MKRLPIPDPIFFKPVTLGALSLSHRIVMPSIVSGLLMPDGVPTDAVVDHYRDRATFGGLMVSEPVLATPGDADDGEMPGLFDTLQVNGWREVTGAVHRQGGLVLAHLSVPADAARASGGIDKLIRRLRSAAENAGDAGFDGIELDVGAAGLSNHAPRLYADTDDLDDRGCLLLEMLETLAGVYGNDRLGVWTASPTKDAVLKVLPLLGQQGLAYVHLPAARSGSLDDAAEPWSGFAVASSRPHVNLIVRGAALSELPAVALNAGSVAAVSHGAAFLANPDLPRRLLQGLSVSSVEFEG